MVVYCSLFEKLAEEERAAGACREFQQTKGPMSSRVTRIRRRVICVTRERSTAGKDWGWAKRMTVWRDVTLDRPSYPVRLAGRH